MPFTTPEQAVLLAVILLAGWLLGYASAPSVKAWKRKVRAQSDSFTAYHGDAEDRVRAANQRALDLKHEADALRADHAEAERTIATLRAAATAPPPVIKTVRVWAPVVTAPGPVPTDAPAADPVPAASEAVLAPADGPAPIAERVRKGWFGSTQRDDLTRVRGISGLLATRLFGVGVVRFEDIEKLSGDDELALEQRLGLPGGIIAREQWRAQAGLLRSGLDKEHEAQFGAETAPSV